MVAVEWDGDAPPFHHPPAANNQRNDTYTKEGNDSMTLFENSKDGLDLTSAEGQAWAREQAEAAQKAMAEGKALLWAAQRQADKTGVFDPMRLLRQQNWERLWPTLAPDGSKKAAPAPAPVAAAGAVTPPLAVKHLASARQVKAAPAGGPGVFTGYLSTYVKDSYGDVVEPGAFAGTIQEAEARRGRIGTPYLFPLLWQHDTSRPIGGILDAKEDATGLLIKAQLDLDNSDGQRAYSGLTKGYAHGLSIGYIPLKAANGSGGARHLLAVKLLEGSVVTFPANPETWVTTVQ